jgi:hypothetical protein
MASLHNLANNLLHPALHSGSQLLPDDASDYVPGSDVDEDNIIDINPPVINVATCKYCNLHINHHKKSEVAKLHLNKCCMFCKLTNSMEDCNHPDWFIWNKKKGKTVASLSNTPRFSHQTSINQ